jgi:hypothetical protein
VGILSRVSNEKNPDVHETPTNTRRYQDMMMMNPKETYTCSICNNEINTAEMKMMIDRDEDMRIKGILCVDCSCAVHRDDPFVLLRAIDYILLGGYPEDFEDDGDVPRSKKTLRGLTEQDRDLLEKLIGKREFTTLRDEEFSIPKPKGKRKTAPKKKKQTHKSGMKGRSSATKSKQPESVVTELAA